MTKILLRAGKTPFDVLDPVHSLEDFPNGVFGTNVGNLIYSDAMHRILSTPASEVVANSFLGERPGVTRPYVERINREFSHFVVPLANAFRPSFMPSLDRMTETIEQLNIPVTVVGVGIAGGVGSLEAPIEVSEPLRRSAKRFVAAVLNRSATIGVRGEETRRFMRTLGFGEDVVDVIGCPSLFRNGRDLRISKKVAALDEDSLIALNISPYVPLMGPVSLRHAERYPNLAYIAQDIKTMRLMMWGKNREDWDAAMPTHVNHPLYVQGRMLFFVDSKTWIDHLRTCAFSFGTRIHGNIASLVAGTPAVVLVHDARTHELARYHHIPHRMVPELTPDIDAAALYEEADYSAFNDHHAGLFEVFHAFLKRNNLQSIFDEGQENAGYDRALSEVQLPEALRPLSTVDEQGQARIAWLLEQKRGGSRRQNNYSYTAPLPHERPKGLVAKMRPAAVRASDFLKRRLRRR